MDIVSCNSCGVVIDRSVLKFPDESDYVDELPADKFTYQYGNGAIATVPCPVCGTPITEE